MEWLAPDSGFRRSLSSRRGLDLAVSLEPVTLDTSDGDGEAVAVYRNGRLLAVLCRLSKDHGALEGSWFVEALFGDRDRWRNATFASLADVEEWAAGEADDPPPRLRQGEQRL